MIHVYGLNTPIIRLDEKENPTLCWLPKIRFNDKDTEKKKVREWKKDLPCK